MSDVQADRGERAVELDVEFDRVWAEINEADSDAARAMFGLTYQLRLAGISLTKTREEQVRWAKQGAINAGRAALKAVRQQGGPE